MYDSKQIRHGLGVRIAGSHPAGPGSIPGAGILFFGACLRHLESFYRRKEISDSKETMVLAYVRYTSFV